MAKPRKFLKKILQLLDKRPMTSGDLVRKTEKSRKVIGENLQISQKEGLVNQDVIKRYHLTMLGKAAVEGYVERPIDKVSWQIESQIIDNISWRSNRPRAICTLMIKNAEKIKELDDETAYNVRYNLELPENATAIKSALARLVDSILETIGKDWGLYTVRDGQLAESLLLFPMHQQFPGYDFEKRYTNLADTSFKVLIEFDGKKWVRTQRLNDVKKFVYDTRESYTKYHVEQILSQDRRKRINDVLQILMQDWNKRKDILKYSNLFEKEEELREHLYKLFEQYGEKNDLKEIVDKAIESGLLQTHKKTLTYLKVNPDREKIQQFYNLIND